MLCGLPVPFLDNYRAFQVLVWLLLFFGGFIVPVVTGILLTSVKPLERTIANSVANLSYNVLGYLPSPFVYGFVCTLTGGTQSRYGIGLLMYMTIPASLFLFLATVIHHRKLKQDLFK
jgi:MFS family permease